MSTLQVGTIKSSSSAAPVFQNTSGTEKGQLAKAWIQMKQNGTYAIRDSFNVSSISDDAYGRYTVNFSNAFSNATYCFTGTCSSGGDNGNESIISLHSSTSNQQTTLIKFRVTKTINGAYNEKDTNAIAFFGDN
jgi:hypothetical protein